jgi:hypothetical protein
VFSGDVAFDQPRDLASDGIILAGISESGTNGGSAQVTELDFRLDEGCFNRGLAVIARPP